RKTGSAEGLPHRNWNGDRLEESGGRSSAADDNAVDPLWTSRNRDSSAENYGLPGCRQRRESGPPKRFGGIISSCYHSFRKNCDSRVRIESPLLNPSGILEFADRVWLVQFATTERRVHGYPSRGR